MIFSVLIIKALLIKKLVKKIHSFSSSFKVIDFIPDFFSLFNCIRTLYFFAKLVTISFFLRGILGNALSALLMERCVETPVSSLVGVGESWSICSNFLYLVSLFLSLFFLFFSSCFFSSQNLPCSLSNFFLSLSF